MAHRRRDSGAGGGRQLHRGGAHPSRGAVDEGVLAQGQRALREEGVVGCDEGLREAGRLLPADRRGHREGDALFCQRHLRLGPPSHQRHDAVARSPAGHRLSRLHYLARQLEAGDVGRAARRRGVAPGDLDEVGVVDPRRPHPHQHLTATGAGIGALGDDELALDDGGRSHDRPTYAGWES